MAELERRLGLHSGNRGKPPSSDGPRKPRRGSLPEHLRGIVVHDHRQPCDTLEGVLHALCNAHHLRDLQALIEIEREDWARRMQILLRRACHILRSLRSIATKQQWHPIQALNAKPESLIAAMQLA